METNAQSPPTPSAPPAALPRPKRPSGPPRDGLTPAMRQYHEQKARVGDAILLFRMGDFYETFHDDARTIARVLGLALTTRDKNSDQPVPLAGIPYHALDRYLARLVRAGYKVAISEQIEDPRQAQGVVQRDIVRIVTPGTLTEEALLDERADNFLAAICHARGSPPADQVGLACVELASGRFFAQMLPVSSLLDELARLRPAELLVPEAAIDAADPLMQKLRELLSIAISPLPAHLFDAHEARTALCRHFQVATLAGFGFDEFDASLQAAAAVLAYLRETQQAALAHILRLVPRRPAEWVQIDHVTLRSLEVERTLRDGSREGSLLSAIDLTVSPMGSRRLREWLCYPLRDVAAILARQTAISTLLDQPERLGLIRGVLRDLPDLERILARLGVGRVSPRDLFALGRSLASIGDLAAVLQSSAGPSTADPADLLGKLAASLEGHADLGQFLTTALREGAPPVLREGGFIADGHHAELDRLRNIGREGVRFLAELQAREARRTGIPTLKIDYNSVFGHYIEISHQHRDKVPPEYVRKQTVRNAERYITDELKRFEHESTAAADCARQLELQLFDEIRARAAADLPRLQAAAEAVAALDVLAGLAELARVRGYCRPEWVASPAAPSGSPAAADAQAPLLEIVDGRHPVLDVLLAERFVPNDCRLSADGHRLIILTGPNMAGKSTYIRQVALLALLAHTGSYAPARSMRLSPLDRLFARVGASDELARGQSTFMVEMVETARILNNAGPDSLVVLDEIGRGTSTYDGLAIAWAVTEYLSSRVGCRALFATHYHELTELGERLAGAANFNVAVREELRPAGAGRDVVFLHKIVPGPTDRSYGVHVAAMAGLPAAVVRRSEAVLADLEREFTRRVRRKGLVAGPAPEPPQMLLFADAPEPPPWWVELEAAIRAADPDRTTPLEALSLLQKLRSMLRPTEARPSAAR